MTPEAVVFDIGNVLIEWQPERFYDQRIGPERRREMFEAVDLHGINERADKGEDFRSVVTDAAAAYPDFADEIMMWHDCWLEMASPAIDGSVALMNRLRARGVPLFALSNFAVSTFEIAEGAYPFLGAFDARYISGHLGVTKPEADIYKRLEDGCGVAPGALLFTDDKPENIETAKARGWQVHLFDGPEGLAARLQSEGLIDLDGATA